MSQVPLHFYLVWKSNTHTFEKQFGTLKPSDKLYIKYLVRIFTITVTNWLKNEEKMENIRKKNIYWENGDKKVEKN